VATCTLEILEARPGTEVIVVPVGGGSGAAGACVVAKAVRPSVVKVVTPASDSSSVPDLAPAPAVVGAAAAILILGAAFAFGGGDRRRPALG